MQNAKTKNPMKYILHLVALLKISFRRAPRYDINDMILVVEHFHEADARLFYVIDDDPLTLNVALKEPNY